MIKKRSGSFLGKESTVAYLMILPTVVLIFSLGLVPIICVVWYSLSDIHPIFLTSEFVGLANYAELVADAGFWFSMRLTGYYTVVSIALQMTLGILVALLLNRKFKGRGLMRAVVLIPWTVPTIVNSNLWLWIYNTNYGVLNKLLGRNIAWLGDSTLAINAIILASTWRMLPLVVLMMLAAMQSIPASQMEAAQIDGAGSLQRFRFITIPHLKPMLMVVLVLRTIQTFRVFDIVYTLTRGGPNNGTMVISFYSYFETFNYLNYGKGSAVSMMIMLVVLVLSGAYMKLLRTEK